MTTFQSSAEASQFIDLIDSLLKNPMLKEWVSQTDQSFGTDAKWKLKLLQEAMAEFVGEMESAE